MACFHPSELSNAGFVERSIPASIAAPEHSASMKSEDQRPSKAFADGADYSYIQLLQAKEMENLAFAQGMGFCPQTLHSMFGGPPQHPFWNKMSSQAGIEGVLLSQERSVPFCQDLMQQQQQQQQQPAFPATLHEVPASLFPWQLGPSFQSNYQAQAWQLGPSFQSNYQAQVGLQYTPNLPFAAPAFQPFFGGNQMCYPGQVADSLDPKQDFSSAPADMKESRAQDSLKLTNLSGNEVWLVVHDREPSKSALNPQAKHLVQDTNVVGVYSSQKNAEWAARKYVFDTFYVHEDGENLLDVDWEDGWVREERLFLFSECDDRVSIRQELLDEEGFDSDSDEAESTESDGDDEAESPSP